jgi:cellulose synthase/poly-beta-1,6-N-acetylglucosamine synthase-like glycosyltransferase
MWWLVIPVVIYSAGLLALWLIIRRRKHGDLSSAFRKTRVSVVVACRDEEKTITALLSSLAGQDYPAELLEIVVVNDHSTDRTPVAVSEFIAEHRQKSSIIFRLINNPFTGKKSAVRFGVRHADGELILTTDADCVVGGGWVSAYAGFFAATEADMILGEVSQRSMAGFVAQFGMLEFSALQAVTEAAVKAGHPVMCNGANMAFRREVYMRHDGELRDEIVSGDDIFLLHAVKRGGGVIAFLDSRAAAAVTAGAVTAAALLRQRARWASKSFSYRDTATLTLAAATAACNAAVAAAAITTAVSINSLLLLPLLYAIRIIPDYLLTHNNIKKREERTPLLLFIISELIYPFYFILVALLSLFPSMHRFTSRK